MNSSLKDFLFLFPSDGSFNSQITAGLFSVPMLMLDLQDMHALYMCIKIEIFHVD